MFTEKADCRMVAIFNDILSTFT